MEADFDDNSYENKLHVLKAARRNQLEAEIRAVTMLSEVRGEFQKVEDLLRPWI